MDKKYTIQYLGHSAFVVDIEDYYLFFDYVGTTRFLNYKVEEKEINFDDYQDKKVLMFNSHNHFDHYNKKIHKKAHEYKNITTILGDISSNLNNTISIKPREEKRIDDIIIHTGDSTDMGVCYLIDINGFKIYYGGDNADWGYGDNSLYYKEIDYLSNIHSDIDLAFIPVCNFDGERPKNITEGAIYSIKKFNLKLVIPMHAAGREYLYKEFEEDLLKSDCNNKIICMEELGQNYYSR